MRVGFDGDSDVKSRITRSYQKEKCNSPIHLYCREIRYATDFLIYNVVSYMFH